MTNFLGLLVVLVAIVTFIPSTVLARDFIVGDSYGWTINFDYQSWTKNKDFRVGDRLVFKYRMGDHNVYKANGTEFQNCEVPSAASRGLAMTSGNDIVTLTTLGRKWYICGKPNHCSSYNQKLVIVVKPNAGAWAPSPSVPSVPSGKDFVVGDKYGWTINFDYQLWAKDKDFRVGDRLIFKYRMGNHNVYKANGTEFQNCEVPSAASRGLAMTSGNDIVTLTTPGRKWYICGKPSHCSHYNQKLVIIVKPNAGAWAPSPLPYLTPENGWAPSISPPLTSGKDFIVGDSYGWTINFDYQSWAKNKDFRVGDRLVFKYPMGDHNVYKANETEFQNCEVPSAASRGLAMTSGNDIVTLTTPGKKWYICGKPNHCSSYNQKLVIFVKPKTNSWAPSPSHSSAATVEKKTVPVSNFN